MKRLALKTVLAASAALAALPISPAHASPDLACPVITDAAGDQNPLMQPGGPSDTTPGATALDLRSVDLASDTKSFTVVFRVANLRDVEPGYVGHVYQLDFVTQSRGFSISADLSSDGNDFTLAVGDRVVNGSTPSMTYVADGKGTVDAAHNEVRVTFPRRALTANGAAGEVTNLVAYAGREGQSVALRGPVVYSGHSGVITSEDEASTTRSYRMGTATCVRPGR